MTLRELPHDVEVNARQMDPFEGTAYRMLERLGGGDVAEVFAVEHRRLSMRYAAKLLRATFSSDSRTVERFRLEADALAKLEHENVVSLHAYDETPQGVPFIVMELLEGQTLEELLDQQR
ncbi:MAG TPA: protein kinase, partial [Polyangiaceae bacterium]|nr:protein kinase [Polyangiaceae bacterium]